MFEFIQQIADIIVTVIGFVVNMFMTLIQIVLVVPRAVAYIITAVGFLPPFVASMVVISVSVSVVLFLLNHGGD